TLMPFFSNIVKMGGAMDLTGKIDLSAYDKMATDILYIDGKLYQTPGSAIDTRAVYYNKDIFEKNGIKVPGNLSELEQACETVKSKGITPISFGGKTSWNLLFLIEPIMSGVCPDWIDDAVKGKAKLSDPRLLAAFKKYEEWAQKGYFGKNFIGVDEGAMLLNFSKGNTAMCVTGSWNAETFTKNNPDLKFGAFQMPMANGGKAMVVTYSTGYAAYSKTKYPDESVKFLQFATTPEAQQISISIQGGVPGLKGLKAKNELMQAIGTADRQVESFYNILGFWPKDGKNPRKLWEEDSVKWIGGKLKAEDFIKELEDAVDYSKVK
ncbi:MAG: extracellular solute-binding protein, partial [Actinobacteria bacterium]|nr:extracellular solute-binding protein [Actinomycetota bacterium]